MNHLAEDLFHDAMDQNTADRAVFLDGACAGNRTLRAEIESLLADAKGAENLIGGAIRRLASSFLPAEGERVGPYRLQRCIGEGGMGVVFLAVRDDGEFEQRAAIKFVNGGGEILSRFRQERRILARLIHPNIARLIDGGVTENGVPYMVMEYFPGERITDYCTRNGLPVSEKLRLFRQVCEAVEHAHRSLIVHRDLKPSNILVNEDGALKLLDFGIAKLLHGENEPQTVTATGMQFFTPDYASPEQILGEPVTTATDVYSLGALLFEMLSGRRPHSLSNYTPAEITHAVCVEEAPALGMGNELDHIVQMALRKEPERRYQSAAALADDVSRFLTHHPVAAKPDSRAYRFWKFTRRNRVVVAAAAFAIVSLAVGMGVAAWQARVARQEAEQARRRFEQVRSLAHTVLFDFDARIHNLAGATPARELLVKTALQYLDSLHAEAGHDTSLRVELATAYEKVADVQGEPARPNLGQRQAAIASYRKAKALWESIEDTPAFDPLVLARVCLKLHDVKGDRDLLMKGEELSRRALAAKPGDRQALTMAVRVERGLGLYYTNRLDGDNALRHFGDALRMAEHLNNLHHDADSARLVAAVHAQIANAALRKGDPHLAVQSADRMQVLREKMLALHPDDVNDQRQVFKAHLLRGHALGHPEYFHLGRPGEALDNYRTALRIAQKLLDADPNNALARGDLADANWSIALVMSEQNPQLAKSLLGKTLEQDQKLVTNSPHTLSFLHNLANCHYALAGASQSLGERDAAVQHLTEAARLQRTIAKARPEQAGLRHNMIITLARLGEALLVAGNVAGAATAIEESLAIAASVPRDVAYHQKLPAIATAYAAKGRLSIARQSADAGQWFNKSLEVWEILELSGVSTEYLRPRRDPVRLALFDWQRRLITTSR